jgi:hypothetical protein
MGIVFGLGLFIAKGREPRRLDPKGERVRAALTERDSTPMDEAASVSYGISARQL